MVWICPPEPVRYSGNPAAHIWAAVMKPIHSTLESKYFSNTRPNGVVSVKVCRDSGLIPTEACTHDQRGDRTYTEYFVKGTEPKETCSCHVMVDICEDTGLLANEYCTNRVTKVFITRPNADTDLSWQSARDKDYMLTIKEMCTKHKQTIIEEPIVPPEKPTEPDEPENPDKPDEPNKPNEPENPDEPDKPENPDKPGDNKITNSTDTAG